LANILTDAGTFKQTQPLIEKILDAARTFQYEGNRAEALTSVASILSDAGETERAQSILEQALDAARGIDIDSDRAEALSPIADALANAGAFKQALDAARDIDNDQYHAEALTSVANTLTDAGETERAQSVLKQAINAARNIDNEEKRAEALTSMSSTLADAGAFEQTQPLFEKIVDAARAIEDDLTHSRAEAVSSIATALVDAGETERAQPVLEQALDDVQDIDWASARAEALSSIADALDAARDIDFDWNRAGALSGLANVLTDAGAFDQTQPLFEQALDAALTIDNLSVRAYATKKMAEQKAQDHRAEAFAQYFPQIELSHDGWTDLLSTWREALLEHTDEPRPLLRQSFTLYPFDAEAAAEGVHSLIQAHVQVGAMDHAEAIARECPELELDMLVPEPDPPIPEGCDPETLPPRLKEAFDNHVEDYKAGRLGDTEFEERVSSLSEVADELQMLEGLHEKGRLGEEAFEAEVEELFEEADLA